MTYHRPIVFVQKLIIYIYTGLGIKKDPQPNVKNFVKTQDIVIIF